MFDIRRDIRSIKDGGTAVRSTSDFVYSEIREDIICHRLAPGTRLVESKVSKDLNVSVTPVREAFSSLVNQGLLTLFPHKGTYVTIISNKNADDIFTLRMTLEKMAAERAFENICDDDIAYYEKISRKLDLAYVNQDFYDCIKYDILFHENIFHLADSEILLEMWNTLKHRIEIIQSYTKRMAANTRHAGLLDALRTRNSDKYIAELEEHLSSSRRMIKFPNQDSIVYE